MGLIVIVGVVVMLALIAEGIRAKKELDAFDEFLGNVQKAQEEYRKKHQ